MSDKTLALVTPQARSIAPTSVADAIELGTVLAKSGFFQDTREAAQAVAKIIKGQTLGLDPVTSLQEIQLIKGKLSLSAGCVAALIQRSGRFTYRVVRLDDNGCELEFSERGRTLGVSKFTLEDAKRANLSGPNWSAYPRNMCFARALTNGARWYCAAVFLGAVYTPDELRGAGMPDDVPAVEEIAPLPRHEDARIVSIAKHPEFVVRDIPNPLDLWDCRHWLGNGFCEGRLVAETAKDGTEMDPEDFHKRQVEAGLPDEYPVCRKCANAWFKAGKPGVVIEAEPVADGEVPGQQPF